MKLTPVEIGKRFQALADKLYAEIPDGKKSPKQSEVKKAAYRSGFIDGVIKLVKDAFDITLGSVRVDDGSPIGNMMNAAAGFLPTKAGRSASSDKVWDFILTYEAPYLPSENTTVWASFVDIHKELHDLGIDYKLTLPLAEYVLYFDKSFFNRKPDGEFNYSSKEFTAVLLHELGHLNYFVTCGRTLVYAKEMFHYTLEIPEDKVDVKEIKDLISACLENKTLPKVLRKYGEILHSTNIQTTDASWSVYFSAVKWFVSSAINKTTYSIFNSFVTKNESDVGNPSLKNERAADNFAVAAGYGPYIARTLVRGLQVRDIVNIDEGISTYYAPGSSALIDFLIFGPLTMSLESEDSGYDPMSVRLQKAVDGAKVALENPDLSEDDKKELIESIKKAQRAIHLYNSQAYVLLRKATYIATQAIVKTGLFIPRLMLVQLRATADMYNQVSDTLRMNNLTYWSQTLPKA